MDQSTTRSKLITSVILGALSLGGCRDDAAGPAGATEATTADTTAATGAQGQAPPVPTLVSPAADALDVPIETELCWDLVDDPDGDAVRYRVFVDGSELTEGKLDESGHEGPCLGPLNFNYEQLYSWQVQAFNPDDPDSQSERSAARWFTTIPDGLSTSVFEDPFDEDLGWVAGGDATAGAWMRGSPIGAVHNGTPSQPSQCAGGVGCVFTGQNPMGVPTAADVAGGTTTLTSPAFDLGDFAAATVTLNRFMYKSEHPETGTLFRVELLVPDTQAPDGVAVHVLEQLELASDTPLASNMWTPTEYTACNVPMVDGSQLRLVATDLGMGVLEAAVDSVEVRGQLTRNVCDGGLDSVCDPNAAQPCPGELLCCAQGTVNTGVYRCSDPVPSITYPDPGPVGSMNGPMGCDAPDLFVEEQGMDIYEQDRFFEENSCEIVEGCVTQPGWRRLLRFDTQTPNAGSRDMMMGVPSNHPDLFHFSECHQHYHFDGYANYELQDLEGNVVAVGHKQAFCLIDWSPWAWPEVGGSYNCGNQGISLGWQDIYGAGLDCQYVDITDVEPGDYMLQIGVNLPLPETAVSPIVERDYDNNVLQVPVTIEAPDTPPE